MPAFAVILIVIAVVLAVVTVALQTRLASG